MKIMMICDYPMTPSDINGGVAAAAYNLVQALLEYTPVEVTAIGFWPDFNEREPRIIDAGRLRIIRCPQPKPRAHLRNYGAERRIFRRFIEKEQPDVIHAQSEGIYASVAVNSGLPNVYTIHGIRLTELKMQKPEMGLISYLLRTSLIRRHHRKAANIVAINDYTEHEVRGLHNAHVRIIHNAVDERFFGLYTGRKTEPGRLLLVGGVRPRKDIVTCLRALKELVSRPQRVTLDIVGPNDPDALVDVEEFISANHLSDRVTIRGLVPSEDVENLYREADIFVMTSVEESSPIAIVQAMAAGKPVISTNVGGIAEMVSEGHNGYLVDSGDHAAIAERIARLLDDRELHHAFCKNSRQLAIDDWSTKAVAMKSYAMYREIAGET